MGDYILGGKIKKAPVWKSSKQGLSLLGRWFIKAAQFVDRQQYLVVDPINADWLARSFSTFGYFHNAFEQSLKENRPAEWYKLVWIFSYPTFC